MGGPDRRIPALIARGRKPQPSAGAGAGFLHILNHSTGMLSHLHQNTDHCPQSTMSGDATVSSEAHAALAAGGLDGLLAAGASAADTALAVTGGMGSEVAHHQGPVNLQGHISRLRTEPESRVVNPETGLPAEVERPSAPSERTAPTAEGACAEDLKSLPGVGADAPALADPVPAALAAPEAEASVGAGALLHLLIGELSRCAERVDPSAELNADVMSCLDAPIRGLSDLIASRPHASSPRLEPGTEGPMHEHAAGTGAKAAYRATLVTEAPQGRAQFEANQQ
jgi:hypothetical protein